MTIIFSFVLLILLIFATLFFYVVGLFNARISDKVELVLFVVANLEHNKKNARKFPRRLRVLAKALIHKRHLLENKVKMRKKMKEIQKTRR